MKTRALTLTTTTILALCSGMAIGGETCTETCDSHPTVNHATNNAPDGIASLDTIFTRELASTMLPLLPAEDKAQVIAAEGIGSEAYLPKVGIGIIDLERASDFSKVQQYATPELWARMSDTHRNMLLTMTERAEKGLVPAAACFAPGTDPDMAMAFSEALFGQVDRYQTTSRWSSTATNGSGLQQGDPTTLTYSFPPNGTFCPNIIGVTGNSNLHTWLNGLYGSINTWQPLFQQVFDSWSDVCANTYIYEPNDDGVNLNGAAGSLGVRGDIRIAAITIDGNSNVLAYNNFPNDGDMVFDSADNFFNSLSSGSIRFRNVAAHEHGHGMGLLHVCPISQTKLMEPFVTTSFDGPQLDDILGSQRHYGDVYEPNDNPLTEATDLGNFGGFSGTSRQDLSIDDNADQDYFLITVTSPSQITMTVTPAAATYIQGPQTSACNTGTSTNYNAIQNLRLDVYDANNVFVALQSSDVNGTGSNEAIVFNAVTPGDYLFRVSASGNINNIQLYDMTLLSDSLPFLDPTISASAPSFVDPGVTTDFSVTINANDDSIVGGSALLNYRINGGSYSTSALAANGGSSYTATLPPALCDDTLEFFLSVEGDTAGVITLPAGGASAPFSAVVGTVDVAIDDNFETNMGWTVSGPVSGAAEGQWERAVPSGDGSRGDAPDDFDGSGRCYVTGNGTAGSNTDVDGGQTILTSPTIDLSSNPEAIVSYARWYDNTGSGTGAAPGEDIFTVEISNNNGASWVTLEIVGPVSVESQGGWFEHSARVADFVTPTNQVQVRFIAEDIGSGSVVEAAVDAFDVTGTSCEDPDTCAADLTGDGALDIFDVFAFLDLFNAGDLGADITGDGTLDIFDVFGYLDLFNAGCP
ncbi:MAG: matrixin family metalloprotease [Phycisphaerales bacterium]|nr:matrixin family metalloprotease [Phycisphaerales bacterium]